MSVCQSIGALLDGYHDGELGSLERTRVERHLETCPACCRDLASLAAVGQAVRATVAGTRVPADMWQSIVSQLPAGRAPIPAPRRARAPQRRRWLPAIAAAAVAASVFLITLDLGVPTPQQIDAGPSGVVRSVYAPEGSVMVLEAEKSDEPTIIWLMDDAPEAAHVRI